MKIGESVDCYAISYYRLDDENTLSIPVEFVDCNTVDRCIEDSTLNMYDSVEIFSVHFKIRDYQELFGGYYGTIANEDIVPGNIHKMRITRVDKRDDRRKYTYENEYRNEVYSSESRYNKIAIDKLEELDDERSAIIRNFIISMLRFPEIDDYDYGPESSFLLGSDVGGEKKTFEFVVHNVGQGLATSIAVEGESPFLYFDYGRAYGANAFTIPATIDLPIRDDALIILSHLDEDHWCGLRTNGDELKCTWLVPKQRRSIGFNILVNSIRAHGGQVNCYGVDINLGSIYVGHTASTINPTRKASRKHESGFAMYINAYAEEKECKIVVSGDQDYDYQDSARYNNVDILVACHHGGKYCWSKRFLGVHPGSAEKIVYSYGHRNTHRHPSKIADYQGWGWSVEHHTPSDLDYIKKISFR